MISKLFISLFITGLLTACVEPNGMTNANKRQLWRNGEIYTVNKAQPWANAMVVEGGKILFIGNDSTSKKWITDDTQVIDLKGKTVLPGIHDVHLHPLEAASEEVRCILNGNQEISTWLQKIGQCAQKNTQEQWLLGWGYSILTLLESSTEPRQLLDDLNLNRPIAIMEESSHSVWVINSFALKLLGFDGVINNQTIKGGAILLNKQGKANGILLDSAGDLAFDLAMRETPQRLEKNYQSLLAGLAEVARHGITSIVDARIYWQRGYLKAWQRARDENMLTARSVLSLWAYPNMNDEAQLAYLKSLYDNNPKSLLRINQIKFYSDGITDNSTAALLMPYLEYVKEVGPRGLSYFDENRLTRYVTELAAVGFDMHIHAIGDRAVRESLNAIEGAQNTLHKILTHVEMVDEKGKKRFKRLNVIAYFQLAGEFTHPTNFVEKEPLIGKKRAHAQLPVRDIYDTGAVVTLSSDWDVSSLSPFVGMQNALTRGKQSLPDLDAVVAAYTHHP